MFGKYYEGLEAIAQWRKHLLIQDEVKSSALLKAQKLGRHDLPFLFTGLKGGQAETPGPASYIE